MEHLALPLRVRGGSFSKAAQEESLLCFAVCFFSEWRGSVPHDPEFGAVGCPWGRREAPLAPLEPVLNEFRKRFGSFYEVRAGLAKTEEPAGKKLVRTVTINLRSNPEAIRKVEFS
jgi:hypothetical protein